MKKKETLILIGIIVVLAVYLALRKTDRTHYTLPDLPQVKAAKIDRIEIMRDGQALTLSKKDDRWYIAPDEKLADKTKAAGMAEALADLKVTALVSKAASYNRYELDEKARIVLKGWRGDKIVRELDLGKAASTFQHTFVKLPGDPNVYHAVGHLRPKFDFDADALRDLNVMTLTADDIEELTLSLGNDRTALKRQMPETTAAGTENQDAAGEGAEKAPAVPEPQWIDAATDQPVAAALVGELMQEFGKLECSRYLEAGAAVDLQDQAPAVKLEFIKGDQAHTLTLFAPQDKDTGDYSGISSQNDDAFVLAKWKVEDLEKKIRAVMGLPPEDEQSPETAAEADAS